MSPKSDWDDIEGWSVVDPARQETKERLKRDTTATVRAIAENSEIFLTFGQPPSLHSPDRHFLPSPPEFDESKTEFRGRADRIAYWQKYHEAGQKNRANDEFSRKVHNAFELVRVETVGSKYLLGSQESMYQCAKIDSKNEQNLYPEDDLGPQRMALALRDELNKQRGKSVPQTDVLLREDVPALLEGLAEKFTERFSDQAKFSDAINEMLVSMGKLDAKVLEDPEPEQSEQDDQQPEGHDNHEPSQNSEPDEDQADNEELEAANQEQIRLEQTMEVDDDEADNLEPGNPLDLQSMLDQKGSPYKIYTTQYDQVVKASDLLSDPREISLLKKRFDQATAPYRPLVKRLANKLQRIINVEQLSTWKYELEEGNLDPRRLTRIVTNPTTPVSYMLEDVRLERDTLLTVLIDSSGSMRGKLIALAAMSAEIVASTLERCSVRTEVLGFTTDAWKGGQSSKKWMEENRPLNPGRLSDIMHIVYKDAKTPWRKARQNLILMLREGLLKDNIDGEALIWAHDRLMRRPEKRKILMVISDGAPVDDSTLLANGSSYLDAHLREVVKMIEDQNTVEIVALGIGHDVSRYYKRAITLHNGEGLASAMLNELSEFLKPRKQSKQWN